MKDIEDIIFQATYGSQIAYDAIINCWYHSFGNKEKYSVLHPASIVADLSSTGMPFENKFVFERALRHLFSDDVIDDSIFYPKDGKFYSILAYEIAELAPKLFFKTKEVNSIDSDLAEEFPEASVNILILFTAWNYINDDVSLARMEEPENKLFISANKYEWPFSNYFRLQLNLRLLGFALRFKKKLPPFEEVLQNTSKFTKNFLGIDFENRILDESYIEYFNNYKSRSIAFFEANAKRIDLIDSFLFHTSDAIKYGKTWHDGEFRFRIKINKYGKNELTEIGKQIIGLCLAIYQSISEIYSLSPDRFGTVFDIEEVDFLNEDDFEIFNRFIYRNEETVKTILEYYPELSEIRDGLLGSSACGTITIDWD